LFVGDIEKEPVRALMQFDLKCYLVDDILMLTDKMSMASSVEARVPLLDHRLVEFCYSIPERVLFPNKKPKAILKEIFSDLLPPFIFKLPKRGFAGPSDEWLYFLLKKGVVEQNLLDKPTRFFKEYFNLGGIKSLFEDIEKNKNRYVCTTLWNLFIFDIWCRVHIEGEVY